MKELVFFLLLGGVVFVLLAEVFRQVQRQQRLNMLKRALVLTSSSDTSVELPKTFSGRAQLFFRQVGMWLDGRKLVSQKTLSTIKVAVGPHVYYSFLGAKLFLFVLGCVLYIICYLLFHQPLYPIVFPIFGLIAPDMVMSRWRKNYITNVQAGMADALPTAAVVGVYSISARCVHLGKTGQKDSRQPCACGDCGRIV